MAPRCHVIGVEPAAGDDATRSFKTGALQTVPNPQTIADGARTSSLGQLTFPLVRRYVHDMVTVTDDQLIAAMTAVWERMKLIVEPTGALAAAAVLSGVVPVAGKRVGIVLSGGNVELARVAQWLAAGHA
jgi:threonine dehydratase